MKSVVMVAYNFPPEGNAGVYRPLRFVRHLPALGWQLMVITVETESYERYDPSRLALISDGVEVISVRNRDPWRSFSARRSSWFRNDRIGSEYDRFFSK